MRKYRIVQLADNSTIAQIMKKTFKYLSVALFWEITPHFD